MQENESNHSKNLKSKETESEQEETTENKKEMPTAYIAKIPEFTEKWFKNLEELFENWQAFKDAFLQQFTNNNIFITLCNHFCNIKQETSETKVHSHVPADLATAIRHAKNYEMAIKKANHTKLTNLQRKLKTTLQTNNNNSNNHKNINFHSTTIKTTLDYHPTTNLKIVIIVEFQDTKNEIVENYKETNKTEVINIIFHHKNLITNLYHQLIIYQNHKIKTVTINQLYNQYNNNISNLYQFSNIRHHSLNNIKYQPKNWFKITNLHPKINLVITTTESIQITNFQQTALFENEAAAPRSNPFNNTIPSAQIAQNTNLSDIFPFEFKANKSPFLLSNAAVNEQKAITAMYTEATVEEKPIQLILDNGSTRSIITYQLIQQLNQNVDRLTQTVIVTANSMKKTPVGEINNFPFTIDGITILVKANANLDWKTQELKISYQEQYTIVSATCDTFNKCSEKTPVFEFKKKKKLPFTETYMALGSTSNMAEETEQKIFEESKR
ncbi:hypothetical protein G9A89_008853 [Geosiphon pyriformis]|nr:hypothetical protein G9A89_008853 [Geosiphon pyriformis]